MPASARLNLIRLSHQRGETLQRHIRYVREARFASVAHHDLDDRAFHADDGSVYVEPVGVIILERQLGELIADDRQLETGLIAPLKSHTGGILIE